MEIADVSQETMHGLLRFARALTGDRGLAEDVVQDVLLRLLNRRGDPITDLDAYARRMIVNQYVSWRRKWSRVIPVAEVHDQAVVADSADRYGDLQVLRQRLDMLTPRQRAAIVLRYLEDRSDEQIGELLGCSQNAVRSLVSRGLAALRVEATVPSKGPLA